MNNRECKQAKDSAADELELNLADLFSLNFALLYTHSNKQ